MSGDPTPELLATRLRQVANTGDARLLGRLDQWLAKSRIQPPPEHVSVGRAWVAQHRHDFHGARREVDALLAREPRAVGAIAMRAHLNLTQGRLRAAQRDCAAMLFLDPRQAAYCGARLAMRRGNLSAADRLLQQLSAGGDALALDAKLLRAEVAAARGDRSADSLFAAAVAASPDDLRALRAYARWLRTHGRAAGALALLPPESTHDGIALERVLAAAAVGSADAGALRSSLQARHAAARAAGNEPELLDAAELALISGDAAGALAFATANFRTQRDAEDVDLLLRAGRAAESAEALQAVESWAHAEGVGAIGNA